MNKKNPANNLLWCLKLQVGSKVNQVPPKYHSLGSAVLQAKPFYSVVPNFTKKFKSSIGATVRNKIWRSFVTEKLHEILCKMFSFDNNIKLAVDLVCILKSLCLDWIRFAWSSWPVKNQAWSWTKHFLTTADTSSSSRYFSYSHRIDAPLLI